jgi:hypothetical protein
MYVAKSEARLRVVVVGSVTVAPMVVVMVTAAIPSREAQKLSSPSSNKLMTS